MIAVEVLSCPLGAAAMTTSVHSPRKHLEDSDDATTAYSSWIGDNASQLSSSCLTCRSSHDEVDDDDNDDDDDSQVSCPQTIISHSESSLRFTLTGEEGEVDDVYGGDDDLLFFHLSLSSSYHSAAEAEANQQQQEPSEVDAINSDSDSGRGEFHFELDPGMVAPRAETQCGLRKCAGGTNSSLSLAAESDALSELVERAHHMLRREQSSDYTIDDYFHQDMAPPSQDASYSPVDLSCRSKMMEWSFRVVEFSFPLPHPSSSSIHQQTHEHERQRKYSTQTIQIVSQAFNLVDRIATLHFHQNGNQAMDRSEYKLTCMVCLHLAAKTCGLFGLYESKHDEYAMEEEEEEYSPISSQEGCESQSESIPAQCKVASELSQKDSVTVTDSCSDTLSWSLSSSMSSFDSGTSSPQCEEGQTILPTPVGSPSKPTQQQQQAPCNDQQLSKQAQPVEVKTLRPPLNILSLVGLSTLCQNEYSIQQLIEMEWKVLQKLDWKISSATGVEWCNLLLDMLTVHLNVYYAVNDNRTEMNHVVDVKDVRECVLINLETAMEDNHMLAPSLAAWVAIAGALDGRAEYDEHETQCSISAYKKMVCGFFPLGDDELEAVRLCL